MLEIELNDGGVLPDGTFRLVHLSFKNPSGQVYEAYSRNVLVRTTPCMERIAFAFNDAKGSWTLIAHDLMAAQVVESTFELS
jgi:hypothetical protein